MITKFIEPWILFPGNLIVLTIVLGFVLLRTARRGEKSTARVGSLLVVTGIFLYLVSTAVVDRVLLGSLERAIPPATASELMDAEAVVVLGGGVIADAPSEILLREIDSLPTDDQRCGITTVRSSLSMEAESRLLYGWRLARRLEIPIVVTGGRVLADPSVPTEGEVAAALLIDMGATVADIRIEDESRTTAENAQRTRDLFGYERVILVTSAYHMRRGVCAFARVGFDVLPAPAAFRTDTRPVRFVHFMPNAGSLDNAATYLRETIGRWYYTIRYGRCSAVAVTR